MKKGVILTLALLFNLKTEYAQTEVTLFGNTYSLILVAPIFLMAIMVLFFLGLILKDNIGKFKLPKIDIGKIKFKKHHEKSSAVKEIKMFDYRNKFSILRENLHKINNEQAFNELNEIAKEFFKDKFGIKHEFAFAELNELVKGHIKDVKLAEKLSLLRYSGAVLDSSQVKLLFKEFGDLLSESKVKKIKHELRFWERVKENFLTLFGKKEYVEVKETKIKVPVKAVPVKLEPEKNIFAKFFSLFRKKEHVEVKPLEIKKIEIPNLEEFEVEKKPRFSLFRNLSTKIQKFRILKLINRGKMIIERNPLIAKRYYARALLAYYKLPIQEEKEIMDNLMDLHNRILHKRIHEKTFLDISKSLIEMKHQGKHISRKSIGLLNTLNNFIKREELLASTRLKEFSHKLKHEERKLSHFLTKEEAKINNNFKQDLERFGSVIGGKITKPELKQKTINLVDNYNKKFDFIYKQPKVEIEHKEVKSKEIKRQPKQIRILQKERNELYNKLMELESGKITHDKLN